MGTARALLSFYGVPGSATVGKKKPEASGPGTGQRTRIDGMIEAGLKRWQTGGCKSMYWLRLEKKQAPEGRNSKNTHVRQDHPAQTLKSPVRNLSLTRRCVPT